MFDPCITHQIPKRHLRVAFSILAGLLSGCGGGGGPDAPPTPMTSSTSHRVAGPDEFDQCVIPQAVRFARELEGGSWRTTRDVAPPGGPLARMTPAVGAATAKNPEGVVSHGPLVAHNCTPGTPTARQWLQLRVRTDGFFGTEVGDHLAFGIRGNLATRNVEGNEVIDGIGIVLHRFWGGVLAERFQRPGGNAFGPADSPQVVLRDGATYLVEMQATTTSLRFRVTDEDAGTTSGWKDFAQPAGYPPLTGTGLFLAALCGDDNARCEAYDRPFRVDLFDIAGGWR